MKQKIELYEIDGKTFKGYWAFPKGDDSTIQKKPAVLVAHAWMGQDHFARRKAEALAELGYIGFAVDLYGDGQTATTGEEAQQLMFPLFENRAMLQRRICGAFEVVQKHPAVDPDKIGGIGFCFGGLTIIELLRSGAPVKGICSFHAVLGSKIGPIQARTVPIAQGIKGALLVLHGHEDPLVSSQDIADFQREMTDAKVDWQLNIYSHTSHAFTNPEANDPAHGLIFKARSSDRAWWNMIHFFSESFGLERKIHVF